MFSVGDYVKFVFVFNPKHKDAILKIKQVMKSTNKRTHHTAYHYYFEQNEWGIANCSGSNLQLVLMPQQVE